MVRYQVVRWIWFGLVWALMGCQAAAENGPSAIANGQLPTVSVVPTLLSTFAPPPPSPSAPPPTATATPAPTPIPTFTPTPHTLAVPPMWNGRLQGLPPDWQLLITEDPAALLSTGVVDAALLPTAQGALVQQRALALTVPFTLDWHDITLEHAQEILAQGHPEVVVLPWDELTPERRPLRIDGRAPAHPDYPLQETWSLQVNAPTGHADALATTLQAQFSPASVVHIAAVGDLMLDRSLGWHIAQGDLAYPFAPVADLLRAADLTIGNLESALGDTGAPVAKSYPFRAPPAAAQALALAGFDVVTLANNHAGDYGPEALLQGIGLLQEAGITPIGAGADAAAAHAPFITVVQGLRLAFLGYVHVPVEAISGFDTASWTATTESAGLAWADPEQIRADVTAVAPQVDLVIVSLHSGYEYVDAPSPPQMAAARAAIDAGADVVLGHHAHILQGIEFYGEGVIVYGLGNFAFEIDGPPETAVLHLWLDADGVRELEIVPAVIQFGGQPRPAESWEAGPIRQRVYYLSNVLNQ